MEECITKKSIDLLTQIGLSQTCPLRVLTKMLTRPEILDLALASTEIFVRLLMCVDDLYIRSVSGVPNDLLFRAYRPVVAFHAPWPGINAFKSYLAQVPGVSAPVKFAFQNTSSGKHLSEVATRFESLTLVKATAAPAAGGCRASPTAAPSSRVDSLCLKELTPLVPHLQVLVLEGIAVSGNLSMLASLKGSLRRLNMRHCDGISGIFNGDIIRLFSDIRLKYGQETVVLEDCGSFKLASDLTDIEDITHIDLSGFKSLEGDIMVFENTSEITEIDLFSTKCFGDIAVLANCPFLSVFGATEKTITGDIAVLVNCELLSVFRARGTKITGDIAVVAHCKNLTCFDCRFSGGIFGDIKTFENTPKITKIDLCHPSCVGDIEVFGHTPELTYVDLYGTKCSGDIKAFENTRKLTKLVLVGSKCFGDIAVLANLKLLSVFDVFGCNEICGDISVLAECASLTKFIARRTRLTGERRYCCLGKSLLEFDARKTQIAGDISVLANCKSLSSFEASETQITGDIAVLAHRNSLHCFEASETQITGDISAVAHHNLPYRLGVFDTQVADDFFRSRHPHHHGHHHRGRYGGGLGFFDRGKGGKGGGRVAPALVDTTNYKIRMLLVESPGRGIDQDDFKQMWLRRYGTALVLPDGVQLRSFLEDAEAAGACQLMPGGRGRFIVHAPRVAAAGKGRKGGGKGGKGV